MTPEFGILSTFCDLLKISGVPTLLEKLFDVLWGRRRTSRSTLCKDAGETLLKIEQAKSLQVETIEKLRQLMEASGYTNDEIRLKLDESISCVQATLSLQTIINFIESGKIEKITLKNNIA